MRVTPKRDMHVPIIAAALHLVLTFHMWGPNQLG